MSHRLVSDSSVVYNAETLQSSILTIVPRQVNYVSNDGQGPFGGGDNSHQVQVSGVLFANYSAETQTRLNGINYTLTEEEWDTYFASQTFASNENYDNVMQCCLLYIKENLMPMFGLTSEDWTYVA